jgi:hypothetical protein
VTPSQDVRRRAVPLGSGRSSRLLADLKAGELPMGLALVGFLVLYLVASLFA